MVSRRSALIDRGGRLTPRAVIRQSCSTPLRRRRPARGEPAACRQDRAHAGPLDVATRPEQLDLPGFRLHELKGELAGYWSITVRANWRIIFRFEEGDATDVDLVDYH
jgi:hypothetical protein